jgi:hypothetical protein
MQEFYESQKFKGKYFTLEEFIDYWAKEFGHGSFDYPARWNGFNLPSTLIEKWYEVFEFSNEDIREREIELSDAIEELRCEDIDSAEKYYVIGVHKQCSKEVRQDVIEHETAHALYYLCPAYKKLASKLIKKLSKKDYEAAAKTLTKMGYGKNVLKDEMQAYFSTQEYNSKIKTLKRRILFANNLKGFKQSLNAKRAS